MRPPFLTHRPAFSDSRVESTREGRDCERSHRATALLLFPRLDARPGAWLLVLAAACTYVAVRALELFSF